MKVERGHDYKCPLRAREKAQVVLKAVTKFWSPSHAGNFINSWGNVNFSKKISFHGVSEGSW